MWGGFLVRSADFFCILVQTPPVAAAVAMVLTSQTHCDNSIQCNSTYSLTFWSCSSIILYKTTALASSTLPLHFFPSRYSLVPGVTFYDKSLISKYFPLGYIFIYLFFYNCFVPLGVLSWEIRVAFPGESQLRQNHATRPVMIVTCIKIFPFGPQFF